MADPGRSAWIAGATSAFRSFSLFQGNATPCQGGYLWNGERYIPVGDWALKLRPSHAGAQAELAMIGMHGIGVTLSSTNFPGPELSGAEGPAIARMMNGYVAEIARRPRSGSLAWRSSPLRTLRHC
jgi:hypothetical protein